MPTLIVASMIAVAFIAGIYLGRVFHQITQSFRSMKTEVAALHTLVIDLNNDKNSLEARISELESEVSRQRHTQNTVAGIEDAGLNIVSQIYRAQLIQGEVEAVISSLQKAAGILGEVRQGPHAYPVDQPLEKHKKSKNPD